MKKFIYILLFALVFIPALTTVNVYAEKTEERKPNASFMTVDNYVSCGSDDTSKALIKNIPSIVPNITSGIYNAVMVIVPLILVVMGSIDLIRGAASQNEDEIKKSKTNFMKRLVVGILTFLIVIIVKFVVSAAAGRFSNSWRIVRCIDCFVNNDCVKMNNTTPTPAPTSNTTNS